MRDDRLALYKFIQEIRDFFKSEGFLDVLTPPMVENPGMETHLHPFEVFSAKDKTRTGKYLQSSPEFFMKKLLSEGFEKIFTLSHSFRDEPSSDFHRPQSLMLEWYRAGSHYFDIMRDVENLIQNLNFGSFHVAKKTVSEIFTDILNIDILNYLEKNKIEALIRNDFSEIPLPQDTHTFSWDDFYFLLFLNEIEPKLKDYPAIILYQFPAPLAALSTINEKDPRICDRFELYMDGVEICNCFNELTDLDQLKSRFSEQSKLKKKLYDYSLPTPSEFFQSMEKGIPKSSGVALGVERLFHMIKKRETFFLSS